MQIFNNFCAILFVDYDDVKILAEGCLSLTCYLVIESSLKHLVHPPKE